MLAACPRPRSVSLTRSLARTISLSFSQIHDEVILEGPEEHADEALAEVISDMEHPFETPLLVDLNVDGCYAKSWYEAK